MKRWRQTLGLALALLLAAGGCGLPQAADSGRESAGWSSTAQTTAESEGSKTDSVIIVDQEEVPAYSGEPYVELDGNEPGFTEEELTEASFEEYSQLDELGRCGTAVACVGQDLMPQEERGDISQVKPTGWHSVRYENVEGGSLYNRCHLIGYQLTAENANEENLITGTRYMNVEGMLPFENEVADYVEETDGHVMYRVTPVYEGDNLVASGVQMEAESVEDAGESVSYNVFVYNVQPGIEIDYATGDSWQESGGAGEAESGISGVDSTGNPEDGRQESGNAADADNTQEAQENPAATSGDSGSGDNREEVQTYIVNTNSGKFHLESCNGAKRIKEENRQEYTGARQELIEDGYQPCKTCNP